MPIYEFECRKCKAHLEVFQKMNDKPPVKCRKCGGRLEKLISAPAIQFKGSGWYVTDYAGNGRKAARKPRKTAAASTASTTRQTRSLTRKPKRAPRQRKLPKRLPHPKSPVVIEAASSV